MSKRVFVVINPASGQPAPILHTLNGVFRSAGISWQIGLTQASGDARRMAQQASAEGYDIVAAYGGDGTVMEVADGLSGSTTPLAILPGGTANLMSVELGISKDLAQAAAIIADDASVVRKVDMGRIGDRHFLLRIGIGFAAEKVKAADREVKDRFGLLAYSLGAIKALATTRLSDFTITVDGESTAVRGFSASIDNAGNMGNRHLTYNRKINVSDGKLDVLVAVPAVGTDGVELKHWAGKTLTVDSNPPQAVQVDGEMWGETPVTVEVLPSAVGILVPAPH